MLMEKLQVLDKFPSITSYSAVGHEFTVNESMIWYINKKKKMANPHGSLLWKVLQ